jgi:hypothetical protein
MDLEMASPEEIRRMQYHQDLKFYTIDPRKEYNQLQFPNDEYSSRDHCVSIEDLDKLLRQSNYFESANE